jgi:hypothetical protein
MKKESIKRIQEMEADFVTKFELAKHLDCSVDVLSEWIADGTIPRPHSWPGRRHPVWRRRDYKHYFETGSWPSSDRQSSS